MFSLTLSSVHLFLLPAAPNSHDDDGIDDVDDDGHDMMLVVTIMLIKMTMIMKMTLQPLLKRRRQRMQWLTEW